MTKNIIKGTAYELYITEHLNQFENQIAWMWKKTPEKILREIGIINEWNEHRLQRKIYKIIQYKILNNEPITEEENILMDTGVDIILKKDNEYIFIQCKNYSSPFYVDVNHLGGFYSMIIHYEKKGILYYTSKLSSNIKNKKNTNWIEYINKPFENEKDFTEKYIRNIEQNKLNETNFLNSPYDYQIEAYEKIRNAFQEKKRATLHLPCGLGKTLISMMVSLSYKQIIIISPLMQYCIQNLDRFMNETSFKDYKGLLIDSDGTRNIEEISEFINNNNKIILSVCYKSTDILFELLNKLNDYIIIIDEFHNISKNDLNGLNENRIGKILYSNSKILFMSATPKIYSMDEDDEDEDSEFHQEIFGKIEYKYEMRDAIKTGKICDYEIYIPDILLDNNPFIQDINNEISLEKLDNNIILKCNFLLRAMTETGALKTIVYAKSQEQANQMKNTIIRLNDYFYLDLCISTILSNDSKISRKNKLDEFRNFNGYSIIISVEILNECIDIIECDSVYFSYECKSRIKIIQRMCRSIRKDPKNKDKISKIFIWCNEYDEMSDLITNLKEFDYGFDLTKINIFKIDNFHYQVIDRNNDIDKKYESLNVYLLGIKKALSWYEKFELLENYIIENDKLPSEYDNDLKIKSIGVFASKQRYNYMKNIKLMKNKTIYDLWTQLIEKYPECFINIEEKWIKKLKNVIDFMDKYKRKPSTFSILKNDSENDLDSWINNQRTCYNAEIKMFSVRIENGIKKYNHPEIVKVWNEFIENYKNYFQDNNEKWFSSINKIKNYIEQTGKTPSSTAKDPEIKKLGVFIVTQKKNYNDKAQIMSNEKYYNLWTDFTNEYAEHFKTPEEIWYDILNKASIFMDKNKKRPNKHSTNINEKQLGEWITKQNGKYKSNKMNSEKINNDYQIFLNKYKNYL